MSKQGRFFRNKPKELLGTPYDSMTEKRLHDGPFKDLEFHTKKVPYVIEHNYSPDFIYTTDDGIEFLIEVKGYFQDSSETQKYKWIVKSLEEHQILVLVLENPETKLHWLKVRKDGTKMTMREWAEKQGIMWVSEDEAGNILKGG